MKPIKFPLDIRFVLIALAASLMIAGLHESGRLRIIDSPQMSVVLWTVVGFCGILVLAWALCYVINKLL